MTVMLYKSKYFANQALKKKPSANFPFISIESAHKLQLIMMLRELLVISYGCHGVASAAVISHMQIQLRHKKIPHLPSLPLPLLIAVSW